MPTKSIMNVPIGTKVKGKIDGFPFSGRVQKEGAAVFICQNTLEGGDCNDKLGYMYSWYVNDGSQ